MRGEGRQAGNGIGRQAGAQWQLRRRLDEEGAVVGVERVQPAPMVEEPRPRGAAMARAGRGGMRLWGIENRRATPWNGHSPSVQTAILRAHAPYDGLHSDADATKPERLQMLVQFGLGDPLSGLFIDSKIVS